jgi:ankyrin repeat protein
MAVLLVEKGADLNAKNKISRTPLLLAISKGHMDMAVLLVEKGADLNAKNFVSPHAPIC